MEDDELKNILDSMEEIIPDEYYDDELIDDLKSPQTTFMDFDAVKKYADDEAKESVESIISYFLTDNQIHKNTETLRYLKSKMNNDILSLSNLIFQTKTAEHAIRRLLQEIDSGSVHPRQFEVLSSLQKSKMEIIKYKTFVEIQIENNYKLIRQEMDKVEPDNLDEYNNRPKVNSGSRDLIKRLKEDN